MRQTVRGRAEKIDQMQENELREEIKKFLSQKRYFVALDDFWENDLWEQINITVKVFPDANNRSSPVNHTKEKCC
jgi:hypothetical protein